MKTQSSCKRSHAFTLIEAVMIVFLLLVVVGLLLPALAKTGRRHSSGIRCVSNLKQIGLTFRLWSGDNGDKFPMQMVITNGGLTEPAFIPTPAKLFQIMSNELADSKLLLCPNDTNRSTALRFTNLSNLQISYFVGLDAAETNPATLISGDRNITNGTRLRRGALELTANHPAGWTEKTHVGAGNVGLADGSVQQATTGYLRKAIEATGLATNRLAMP